MATNKSEITQQRRAKYVAAGLCREGCGRFIVSGRKKCQECLDKRRDQRSKLKKAGLCRDGCGRLVITNGTRCRECLDIVNANFRQSLIDDFLAACDHYGGRSCISCGESNLKFLTVDHINGGGVAHARQLGKSSGGVAHLSSHLRRAGYPAGYQILCWNDNLGKSRNGNVLVESNTLYVCDCITSASNNDRWRKCSHGLTYDQRYSRRLVVAGINAYGGPRCACCGEANLFYLTLDHGFDDGAIHRTVITSNICKWVKNHGYPQDIGIRVMCANCNSARDCNGGICPHRDGRYFDGLGTNV